MGSPKPMWSGEPWGSPEPSSVPCESPSLLAVPSQSTQPIARSAKSPGAPVAAARHEVLVAGYSNEETALLHGVVLRSCARHEELAEAFLTSGLVFELVKHARHPSIDISSDAFYTLREMLLAHKEPRGGGGLRSVLCVCVLLELSMLYVEYMFSGACGSSILHALSQ